MRPRRPAALSCYSPSQAAPAAGREVTAVNDREPDGGTAEATREEVAEALRVVESGVRQRAAQIATLRGDRDAVRSQLLDLKATELLQEAIPVSPRPLIGPLLVFLRRAVYHLFFKWQLRPLMQQQNRFNQAAARLIEDCVEGERRLADEIERLHARLDEQSAPEEAAAEEGEH